MIFGTAVSLSVATGLLPPEAAQLGAISSSLTAIILARLQTRHNALISSLMAGVIWAIWHVPLIFIKGTGQVDIQSRRTDQP